VTVNPGAGIFSGGSKRDVALDYIRAIRTEIEKLSYMALSIAPVDKEPWHSRGVRKIIAKNFYIYYRRDESSCRVYIMNVIYAKRDQLKALKKMQIDH
jgi:toxin ParE1/3/4